MKKNIFGFVLVAIMALTLPLSVSSAEFAGGDEFTLRHSETIEENLYATGGNVAIEGSVLGDLLTAGGNMVVSGSVTEDLFVAGGNVLISGNVEGDVRVAGGSVTISGNINGELIAIGGQVLITSQAVVAGDVVVAGGRVVIEGTLNGNLGAYGDDVVIDGEIKGVVDAEGNRIFVKDHAVIGFLNYRAPKEANIDSAATIQAGIEFEKTDGNELFDFGKDIDEDSIAKIIFGILGAIWFISLLVTLITGLVLYKLTKKHTEELMAYTEKNFWKETLRGLILAIVLPIIIVVLFISVFGAGISILLGIIIFLFAFLAKIGAGALLGSLLFKLFSKSKSLTVNWKTITVGIIVFFILKLVPVIGWIIGCILYLAVFGALLLFLYRAFNKKGKK